MGQVKLSAGTSAETLDLPGKATPMQLLHAVVERRPGLKRLLLPADGALPVVLMFLGDEQVDFTSEQSLPDSCEVTLLTPIAGG
jgi:hypothetical protein